LIEFIRQAMHTPRLGGIDPIRSLPQIELLYSDMVSALDKQFKGEK
jgi:hypothetical protein